MCILAGDVSTAQVGWLTRHETLTLVECKSSAANCNMQLCSLYRIFLFFLYTVYFQTLVAFVIVEILS